MSYDLQMQITKSIADLIHLYFSIDNIDYDAINNGNEKTDDVDISNKKADSIYNADKNKLPTIHENPISNKHPVDTQVDFSPTVDGHSIKLTKSYSTGTTKRNDNIESATTKYEKIIIGGAKDKSEKTLKKSLPIQEAVYLQYFRIGIINLDVSTAGFTLNLNKFKAKMEPFICRRSVLDWKKLIWMIEQHTVWSLTKNTVSC